MIDLVKEKHDFHDLLKIMEILRGKDGCPWDAEQTHHSIRRDFLEETYEAVEAIDREDNPALCEELGDVLLQVVFHASIAAAEGAFDMSDVADGICKKLIYRHPHVFDGARAETSGQVLDAWDKLKRAEKGQRTHTDAMNQVAKSLPALMYAQKIQAKARKAGFDWPDPSGALQKVAEETAEVTAAMASGQGVEEELGDLLFSVVNLARLLEADAEQVLSEASAKFVRRFAAVERAAAGRMEDMGLSQLDKLWEAAKAEEPRPEH